MYHQNIHILNKINHLSNKTGKSIEKVLLIYQPHNYLGDTIYDIEVEVEDENYTSRFKRQLGYLNKYLVKYNKKHNTTFNVKRFVFWE